MQQLHTEAERRYPEECCGILIGQQMGGGLRLVKKILPADNTEEKQSRKGHFKISSETIRKAELTASVNGNEIIGFYHSHPDHQAVLSELDAGYVIPGLSYPILSVMNGQSACARSWVMEWTGERSLVTEEIIKLIKDQTETAAGKPILRGTE